MAWYSGLWTRAQRLVVTPTVGVVAGCAYFPAYLSAASLPTELTNNSYGRSDGGAQQFRAVDRAAAIKFTPREMKT